MIHSRSSNSGNSNHNGNSNSNLSNSNHNECASTSSSKMRFCAISESIGGRKRISPEEVTALLPRSKVYIDFSPHPDMERLPWDAALYRCIAVTNGKGAAGFPKDYPIPEEYRIQTFDTDVDVIHCVLRKNLDEYDERKGSFDEYCEFILGEFDKMEEYVKVFLNTIVDELRKAKAEDIVNRLVVADGRNVVNDGCQDEDWSTVMHTLASEFEPIVSLRHFVPPFDHYGHCCDWNFDNFKVIEM